jgi:uncharacterized protein (TIGR00369 family)
MSRETSLASLSGLEIMQAMFDGRLPGAPMGKLIGFKGHKVEPGIVVFEGLPAPEHLNPLGHVHGGFAATLLDSCMGCAVHTGLAAGIGYTTVDLNITYDRAISATTGPVFARGEVITSGRRIATAQGRLTDANGKLLAHGTTTCLIFPIDEAKGS